MENTINEDYIKNIVKSVLSEETSKVNRNEYNRVQFRLDELEKQLNETVKELRKVQDDMPEGLKTITSNRLKNISSLLTDANGILKQTKSKIKEHKKNSYTQEK
jgi:hypothetical protein